MLGPLTSFGFSTINIGVQSLVSLESNADEQGMALGVLQSFGSMGRVIGPILGGIIGSLSIGAPYLVSGIIALVVLFLGQNYLRYMRASNAKK